MIVQMRLKLATFLKRLYKLQDSTHNPACCGTVKLNKEALLLVESLLLSCVPILFNPGDEMGEFCPQARNSAPS